MASGVFIFQDPCVFFRTAMMLNMLSVLVQKFENLPMYSDKKMRKQQIFRSLVSIYFYLFYLPFKCESNINQCLFKSSLLCLERIKSDRLSTRKNC